MFRYPLVLWASRVGGRIPCRRPDRGPAADSSRAARPRRIAHVRAEPAAQDGHGRIRGRVVGSESGTPLRRAQVRISGPDIGSKAALTDQDGRYEFRDLPAGRST